MSDKIHNRIIIAGAGGQGVVLMGKLLATVAVDSIPNVTFFPAYGAEVRGGTSNCQVILSSDRISSPVSEEFDSMVIMNQASADKFIPDSADGGMIMINSSLCNVSGGKNCIRVAATEIAVGLGSAKASNFVMLGAFVAASRLVEPEGIEEAIQSLMAEKPKAIVEINVKAFRSGLELDVGQD